MCPDGLINKQMVISSPHERIRSGSILILYHVLNLIACYYKENLNLHPPDNIL